MGKPNYRMTMPLGKHDALLCSRVLAEESPSKYIKDLIRTDIDSPDLVRFEHENWHAMSPDSKPYQLMVRFYYDTDADILAQLKSVGNPYTYIKSLIYWDMGINPESIPRHYTRRAKKRYRICCEE